MSAPAVVPIPPPKKVGRKKSEYIIELERIALRYGIPLKAVKIHRAIFLNPNCTALARRVIVNDIRRHAAGVTDEMFMYKKPVKQLVITGDAFRPLKQLVRRTSINGRRSA